MFCNNCGARIVGKPGRTGSTIAVGNGFYKGSRPTATCAPCVDWLADHDNDYAYRSQVATLVTMCRSIIARGEEDPAEFMAGCGIGPAMIAVVVAQAAL